MPWITGFNDLLKIVGDTQSPEAYARKREVEVFAKPNTVPWDSRAQPKVISISDYKPVAERKPTDE